MPLKRTGALAGLEQRDETPVIGITFYDLDIANVLERDDADELLRELAIISQSAGMGSRAEEARYQPTKIASMRQTVLLSGGVSLGPECLVPQESGWGAVV